MTMANERKRKRPWGSLSPRETASCKSRKETLMRKAEELEKLCDAKVFLLCYDCDDKFVYVHPDQEDKAIALISEYKLGPKSTRNKEANVWDSLGSDGVKKLMEENNKGNFEDCSVENDDDYEEEELVMLGDLPGDSLAGFWRDLETKKRATEERIRSLEGEAIRRHQGEEVKRATLLGNGSTNTTSSNGDATLIGLSTAFKSGSGAVNNPNLVGFTENVGDLEDKAIWPWGISLPLQADDGHQSNFEATNNFGHGELTENIGDLGDKSIWPWGMPLPLEGDGGHQSNYDATNNFGHGRFTENIGDLGDKAIWPWGMSLPLEADDGHQFNFEAMNNFGANNSTGGFEDFGANAVAPLMLNSNFPSSTYTSGSSSSPSISMPLTIGDSDDHQSNFEAADYLARNLMGFENWPANNNVDTTLAPNTSLCYDLWKGTSVSMDNMTRSISTTATPPVTSNQNRYCQGTIATTNRCHQPVFSPLHEMLPFSFWPQSSQF